MFASRARWLVLLQLLVQEKLVTSRSTLSPDIDIEAILDMSPRTTTIDYDLADFDEQANGPSYATDTAESTPAPSGNATGGDAGKSTTATGPGQNNDGKVVMLGPDSNDNVDGLLLSDVQYDNPGSMEDNVATKATVGTVMSGFGGSVNPDPDYDGDGTSTGDISALSGFGSSSDIWRDANESVSDSTENSDSMKTDRDPSSNGVTSGQESAGPSFSSCFNTSGSSGSTQTDFCRFVNAVYDVCNAHFSSECSSSSESSSTDQSGVTAEEDTVSKETVESGSNMSEESMDTESAVLSPDSSSFDNLAASLESMNSAEMSEKTMNEILKIVKGLCPSVCSAASRATSKQESSESGSTSSESSVESAESSAHSSMTDETYSETSEESNGPETNNESDSGSSDSSNTAAGHTSGSVAEPKPLESSNINMAPGQSDSDTETESDSEY